MIDPDVFGPFNLHVLMLDIRIEERNAIELYCRQCSVKVWDKLGNHVTMTELIPIIGEHTIPKASDAT
jgi:hypothetical protein